MKNQLEKKSAKKARMTKLQKIILGTVATAGLLSVAALAPNALQIFGPLVKKMEHGRKTSIRRARKLLVEKGLLAYAIGKPSFLTLTSRGRQVWAKLKHGNYKIKQPKRWDGKWRVLIFDINEKRKRTRNQLRVTLRSLGFVRLQDSVWVYPYPCEELVTLLKAELKIGYSLLYLIVEEMEGDKNLRKTFDLPN